MFYKNKSNDSSPHGNTYFEIVSGVLQRDTLVLYMFMICLDYVWGVSIDKAH